MRDVYELDTVKRYERVTLLELLDRLVDKGVVLWGDLVISLADIDLIYLRLQLLVAAVERIGQVSCHTPGIPREFRKDSSCRKQQYRSGSQPAGLGSVSRRTEPSATRIDFQPDRVENGLAQLVLTVVELIRRLLEQQALRRVENNSLSSADEERLGLTLMRLEEKMDELKQVFGLSEEDLNLDLGPLGDLL